MAMPQCCYLAKGAKRPSHTTNMQPFQLSLFTFGTQFVLGLNLFWDSIVASPLNQDNNSCTRKDLTLTKIYTINETSFTRLELQINV